MPAWERAKLTKLPPFVLGVVYGIILTDGSLEFSNTGVNAYFTLIS
jgi:hypothetical protein